MESNGFYLLTEGSITAKIKNTKLKDTNVDLIRNNIIKELHLPLHQIKLRDIDSKDLVVKEHMKVNNTSSYKIKSKIFPRTKKRNLFTHFNSNNTNNIINLFPLFVNEISLLSYKFQKENINDDDFMLIGDLNFLNKDFASSTFKPMTNCFSLYATNDTYNKTYDNNNHNAVTLLHFDNTCVKMFHKYIIKNKKAKMQFLISHIKHLKSIGTALLEGFYHRIIVTHTPIKTKILNEEKTIYLIYSGECCEYNYSNYKKVIYDKGDFLYLENIYVTSNTNITKENEILTQSDNVVLFKIKTSDIPNVIRKDVLLYLHEIYVKQKEIRKIYNGVTVKKDLPIRKKFYNENEYELNSLICNNKNNTVDTFSRNLLLKNRKIFLSPCKKNKSIQPINLIKKNKKKKGIQNIKALTIQITSNNKHINTPSLTTNPNQKTQDINILTIQNTKHKTKRTFTSCLYPTTQNENTHININSNSILNGETSATSSRRSKASSPKNLISSHLSTTQSSTKIKQFSKKHNVDKQTNKNKCFFSEPNSIIQQNDDYYKTEYSHLTFQTQNVVVNKVMLMPYVGEVVKRKTTKSLSIEERIKLNIRRWKRAQKEKQLTYQTKNYTMGFIHILKDNSL